ncbi:MULTISPECIES: hypothetical protein [unclassified Solwaraspora]|uniref:hypothetical protein n=1 Tax=unclassified Solwaraspora TaxID=2627926 RepID=UPI00259B34DD|nr:hypothetical protein [Solwaraspora sp. WMMA2056]WJK41615.1 hypothetical protein O7608_04085 [Solwaraspora sp. WMMA2056]
MRDRVRRPATTTDRRALLLPAVLVVAVLILAGCSIGDIRRTPPERAVPSADPTVPADGPGAVEVRPMRVPVPAYYDPPLIEFDHARLGYALFPGCTRSADAGDPVPCPPLLFVTFDAGGSWWQQEHPAPDEGSPSMLVGYGSLVLSTDAAWYRSLDAGTTFTRSTRSDGSMPPEYASVDGPYQVCCQTDPVARVVEVTEQGMVPLPQQPPIPVVQTVGHLGDKLTVAGLREGRLHVAFGALVAQPDDRGVAEPTWQWQTDAITIAEPDRIRLLVVHTAPLGGRWLIAERAPGEFPLVWRINGTQLEHLPVDDPPTGVVSVLPDGGRLLVTTRTGAWAVGSDGQFEVLYWPVQGAYLTRLRDATVQARRDGAVLLNVRQPVGAGWVEIFWDPTGR